MNKDAKEQIFTKDLRETLKGLMQNTIGVYHIEANTKNQLIEKPKKFWKEYKATNERPLFID